MRALRKHLRLISLIFSTTFFIESCTVYKSADISFYEVAKSESKVKIIKKDGKKEKFFRVELLEDGQFYGKKKMNARGEYAVVLIDTSNVQKVQLHDKKKSTVQSIALAAVIIGVIFAVSQHVRNGISVGF